jgi:putative hydrolase of the HAD superfamily
MIHNHYRVIVFDLGNVLIPFDYSLAARELNIIEAGLGDKFLNSYNSMYGVHRSFERGDITNEEFLNQMLEMCDHIIDAETFCRIYSCIFRIDEDMVRLVKTLKAKYKVVLLSNTNEIHRKYYYGNLEFMDIFDKIVLSYEVGAVKPESAIYREVENFTGYKPSEHIFIDDVEAYTAGAKAMGWDAIQFEGYDLLVEQLKKRGIIN